MTYRVFLGFLEKTDMSTSLDFHSIPALFNIGARIITFVMMHLNFFPWTNAFSFPSISLSCVHFQAILAVLLSKHPGYHICC